MRCVECAFDADRWSEADLLTTLAVAGALVGEYAAALPEQAVAERVARVDEALAAVSGASTARDAVHVLQHELHAIGRRRAALGRGAMTQRGSVAALHRSGGGVPKQPAEEVEVTWTGVVGDSQNDRRHHGRPFQALSLWSAETIDALRDEGHPIGPGLAGENITIRDVDWTAITPGTALRVGTVLCEISSYATPCAKNAAWFVDGDFKRMDQDVNPGWGRLYAWVLEPGRIAIGDAVVVEPADG